MFSSTGHSVDWKLFRLTSRHGIWKTLIINTAVKATIFLLAFKDILLYVLVNIGRACKWLKFLNTLKMQKENINKIICNK
jgi:uncharacterized protein involved in cysteine biosynthesis